MQTAPFFGFVFAYLQLVYAHDQRNIKQPVYIYIIDIVRTLDVKTILNPTISKSNTLKDIFLQRREDGGQTVKL